jgi:hypothetical protein
MVLMKNVRDVSQVATLGRQLFLGRWKVLTVCYTDALSVGPYSYLIVDKVALSTIHLNLNLYEHLIFMLPEIFYNLPLCPSVHLFEVNHRPVASH